MSYFELKCLACSALVELSVGAEPIHSFICPEATCGKAVLQILKYVDTSKHGIGAVLAEIGLRIDRLEEFARSVGGDIGEAFSEDEN